MSGRSGLWRAISVLGEVVLHETLQDKFCEGSEGTSTGKQVFLEPLEDVVGSGAGSSELAGNEEMKIDHGVLGGKLADGCTLPWLSRAHGCDYASKPREE